MEPTKTHNSRIKTRDHVQWPYRSIYTVNESLIFTLTRLGCRFMNNDLVRKTMKIATLTRQTMDKYNLILFIMALRMIC